MTRGMRSEQYYTSVFAKAGFCWGLVISQRVESLLVGALKRRALLGKPQVETAGIGQTEVL